MFIIHYSNALVQLYLGIPVGILIFIRILNSFFCQPLFSNWNMPTQVVVFYLNSFQNDCRFGTIFWNSIIFWVRCSICDYTKVQICSNFFQILWKSRCDILVSFPSHFKKLRSILRFWLQKLNCGFFHSFHSWKNTTKQLFQSKFQCRK